MSTTHLFAGVCLAGLVLASGVSGRADIFQWEYINPADPALGKQQSTMLCVSGAGVNAAPGTFFYQGDFTKAYLAGANLIGADANFATLIDADFRNANLSRVGFYGAKLTGAAQ